MQVVAAVVPLHQPAAQEMVVVAMVAVDLMLEQMPLMQLAAEAAEAVKTVLAVMAATALLSSAFRRLGTVVQQQVHRLSPQAAPTQL